MRCPGQGGECRGGGNGRWRGLPEAWTPELEELVARLRAAFPALSPRQAAVALGVWAGLSEGECAAWLDLSTETVHGHFRSVLERLRHVGISRRADLIRAVERKLNAPGERDDGKGSASPEEGIP